MAMVAKIVSELFMLVLAVVSAPSDLKEFRLDVIEHSGRVESLLVRRSDTGFILLDVKDGKAVEHGTIRAVEGKPASYVLKLGNTPEQTFDFSSTLPGFRLAELQKAQALDLKASDGVGIHVQRSGSAVYLTPDKGRITYACHP